MWSKRANTAHASWRSFKTKMFLFTLTPQSCLFLFLVSYWSWFIFYSCLYLYPNTLKALLLKITFLLCEKWETEREPHTLLPLVPVWHCCTQTGCEWYHCETDFLGSPSLWTGKKTNRSSKKNIYLSEIMSRWLTRVEPLALTWGKVALPIKHSDLHP